MPNILPVTGDVPYVLPNSEAPPVTEAEGRNLNNLANPRLHFCLRTLRASWVDARNFLDQYQDFICAVSPEYKAVVYMHTGDVDRAVGIFKRVIFRENLSTTPSLQKLARAYYFLAILEKDPKIRASLFDKADECLWDILSQREDRTDPAVKNLLLTVAQSRTISAVPPPEVWAGFFSEAECSAL